MPGHLPGTIETGPDDPRAQLSTEVYSRASAPLALRPFGEVRRLFDGFELVEPGLVWISQWRPELFGYVSGATAGRVATRDSLATLWVGVADPQGH